MNRSPLESLRENAVTGLDRIREHGRQLTEAKMYFLTDVEKGIIKKLRETYDFSTNQPGQLDRYVFERLVVESQPVPISDIRRLARKVDSLTAAGIFNEKLEWNGEQAHLLAEANATGVTVEQLIETRRREAGILTEGMASSTADSHSGMDDKGMKGIGDDADKDEPKGAADKGSSQKSDRGQTPPDQGGYMDEEQDKTPNHNAMVNKWNGDGKREGYKFVERTGYTFEQLCSMTETQLNVVLSKAFASNIAEGQMVYNAVMEGKMPDAFKKHMIAKGSDADGDGKKGEGKDKPPFMKETDDNDADDLTGNGGEPGEPEMDEKGKKKRKYEDMDYPMSKKDAKEAVAPDQAPKANMAPCPTDDSNTAATNARYKKGAKQNESLYDLGRRHENERAQLENAYGNEGKGHVSGHKPTASTPGTGSATANSSQPEEPGAVPDTPNYSKAKEEDPSNDPKNKGPSKAANESEIFDAQAAFEEASAIVASMLEDRGIERGSVEWNEKFELGIQHYVNERAEAFASE